MEEVDEGFGSNESNHSNFNNKETILNDLKYLNGQNVLDKNTNGNNLCNGNLLKHDSQKGDITDNNKDSDLRNDKNMSEKSPCIGFANALRDDSIKNSNLSEQSNSKEVCESYLRERSLSPTENENSNCSLKDKSKAVEKLGKISPHEPLLHVNGKESEVPNKCNNSDTDEMLVQTESDSSSNSNENSPTLDIKESENKDSFENVCSETVLTENEMDTSCLDKIQTLDRNSQNKTPVKQVTSSAEGERSPFLLDDKVRNSLKGLVAKVKSSELSRESMSPAGSSASGEDIDGIASPIKLHEDEVSLEEETDKQESASLEDTEDCVLDDGEDGISMEIGSENEDDLLEIDSELSTSRKCNNENTDIDFQDESVEDCSNQKSVTNTDAENEDTNSNTAIEIDITSDNEEDAAIETERDFKRFKNASVERIQFEEDSNSNGNSVKINDIVNFLNHDLSGTNSPLTTSDAILIGESKPETIDNEISDTEGNNIENKGDVKMPGVIDVDNSEENNRSSKISVEQTDTKDSIRGNESNEEKLSVTKDKDSIIESDTKNKELNYNFENVENDKNERKNSEGGNLDSKSHEDLNSDQMNGDEKEREINEEDKEVDDDDDDVIFEGASMPAMRNEYQKLSSNANIKQPDDDNANTSFTKGHTDDVDVEEDDDVIFEKETKVEVPPKQNCDNTNQVSCANEGNKSVRTSENNHIDAKTDSNVIENNSSDKVSVITSRNSSDRKRSAEDKDYAEIESKRSKLDLTGLIGKLGSRVEPASIELLSDDSDEEVDKPIKEDKEKEDKSASVEKVEETKQEKNERLVTVTEKELEELVREKVKTYLTSQRDTLVAKLIQKVKELQQNNDLWKRQVKDLQVKVNDVTVLQQKLEKRKAATAALRQITTRNVSVQVDEGRNSANHVLKEMLAKKLDRESSIPPSSSSANLFLSTASSKTHKIISSSQRSVAHVPLVSGTGNGTIRLPIQQSQQGLTTHLQHGSKMVTTTYQTPSVKSLLDTTRVQKTVGSVIPSATAATVVNTSMIEFLPYTSTLVPKPATATFQGFGQSTVTQITTQSSVSKTVAVTKTVSVSKTSSLPSPNTAKVIDLTDDDDGNKTRLVTIPAGIGAVTNQPGVRHVLAPPGAQIVRTGLPNQPTYQLVFSSPPAIRPGMMMSVAPGLPQTCPLLNTVQQSQTLVSLTSPSSVAPGTSLARAAVSATPTPPKAPVSTHPAPFPPMPSKQPITGYKSLPPKPCLKISRVSQGIVLSWNMVLNDLHAEISNYQLFAYQETLAPPVASLWKKVGDVKALPLPMACTLTQFQVGNKYHFAVRAMDAHNRVGDFSDPGSIHLTPNTPTN